jgi:hypothetical protein
MISVACSCGKKFRTSDANAGKRARCAGCGAVLTIHQPKAQAADQPAVDEESLDSLAALAGGAGAAEVFQPAAVGAVPKAAAKPRTGSSPSSNAPVFPGIPAPETGREARTGSAITPSISVSPLVVVLVILAIAIPGAIYWAEHGPMEANRQWKQISGIAEDNLVGQTTRAIQYEYREVMIDSLEGMRVRPKASSMFFDEPAVMWRLPETIHFQVASTEGNFHGDFHPHTYQFEMTGEIAGAAHTLTGSAAQDDQTLFMDGKKIN